MDDAHDLDIENQAAGVKSVGCSAFALEQYFRS